MLVYRISPTGDKRFCYQCLDCDAQVGGYVGSAELSDAETAGAVPFDEAGRKAQYQQGREALHVEQEARRAGRRTAYDDYLQSPEWHLLRQKVFTRAAKLHGRDIYGRPYCEGCGERPVEHVHHLTYEHVRRELLWELVGVCTSCHEKAHELGGGYDGE
jgi:hypothetical protein